MAFAPASTSGPSAGSPAPFLPLGMVSLGLRAFASKSPSPRASARLCCWVVGLPRLRLDGGAARPCAESVALERCLRRAVLVRSSAVRIPRVTTTKAAPLDGDGFAFVASLLRGRRAFHSSGRLVGTREGYCRLHTRPWEL